MALSNRHFITLIVLMGMGCSPEGNFSLDGCVDSSGPRRGSDGDAKVEFDTITDLQVEVSDSRAVIDSLTILDLAPLDLPKETSIDVLKIDLSNDTTVIRLPQGSICNNNSQCSSGYCTDGVCCSVAKCIDTCMVSGGTNCPVYNGFTCSPFGTCRAY
jgi:hypothetical protein